MNNNNTFACEKCGAPVLVSEYDVSKKCSGCGHSNNAAAGRARSGGSGGKLGLVLALAFVVFGGAGYFVFQTEAPPAPEEVAAPAELNEAPEPEPEPKPEPESKIEPQSEGSDDPDSLAAKLGMLGAKPTLGDSESKIDESGDKPTSSVRLGAPQINGRLPSEVIRRVVQQNVGRFRMCHEAALTRDPELAGTVTVSFVVGRDGSVSHARVGQSEISDAAAVACIASAFNGMSFPQPSGGLVQVQYPIRFSPG